MRKLYLIALFCLIINKSWGQSSVNYNFSTSTSGDLNLDKNGNTINITSGATTLVGANQDDAASAVTNIGFDFWFMGTRFTQFSANSNGILRLGGTAIASNRYGIAIAGENLISPFGVDAATVSSTGIVRSKVVGSAPNRCLVVEWKDMRISYSSSTANGTFQARLYEGSGEIEFVYGTVTYNTLPAFGSRNVHIGFSTNNTNNTYATVNSASSTVVTSGGAFSNDYGATGYPKTPTNITSGRIYLFTPSGVNSPSGLSATCVSGTSVTLNWTDNSSNESGFAIYYSTSTPVAIQNANYWNVVPSNSTSATITGLTNGTTYYYIVLAYREALTSSTSASSLCFNPPTSPLLHNTSAAGASVQTTFNHCRNNSLQPMFTFSASHSGTYNTIQIELNTRHDFSGTSYKQTFTGTYASGTKYDLVCSALDNGGLPSSESVYFVRARASSDGGVTWSSYTSGNWIYKYASTELGFHYSTQLQFNTGSLVPTAYGNFINRNDNGTIYNYSDDFVELNEGSSLNTCTGSDQYLEENGSYYPGASYNCITVGYYNPTTDQDWHGFRFPNCSIPQGATILSATFRPFAHNGSGCGGSPNTTNQLTLRLRGADFDNCSAWASGTNTSTGSPRYRTRTSAGVDWNVPGDGSQNWSTGLEITTAPSIVSIIQPIINRPGYAAGNALGLIVDHNGPTGNYWRYFATTRSNAAYAAKLQTTFTNFTNDIQFPNIPLSNFANNGGTVSWDKLYFDVDKSSCGTCDVTFFVYNASGPTLIASGNTSPLNISGAGTAANIYVVARIKRNSSPKLKSFTVTVVNGVLPINLNYFDMTCLDNGKTVFDWKTNSEINNFAFQVQGSTNGEEYFDIGSQVIGNGTTTSSSKYYIELPKSEISDKKYFRLKQIDFDGTISYSPIIYNKCFNGPSKKTKIDLFPNPAKDNLEIILDPYLSAQDEFEVKVFSSTGALVMTEYFKNDLSGTLKINFKELSAGLYNLVVSSGIYYASKSFVIRE